jgi:asparagine synthase (glutamine-hydrolysing)
MDRLGMAHAVEVRNPFLDKRMVGLALSIPGKFKYRNGTSKWILKKSLEGILPHETLYRKKMGFCMPIREWAGELLIDSIDSSIDQFSNTYDVFDADAVKHMLVRFRKGDIALTNTVWTIYFLINWFERWIKKE